uniref:Xylanase inhibitor N-terminal domain-containing protein n=1 Tax=Nelumbo nucifera TaxID=4432 RepID=A0A822ZDL1_NELNU|nr:TPA_asm: hypothetical protein HUJ06_014001 [Nelumbo nucifera]
MDLSSMVLLFLDGIELPDHLSFNSVTTSENTGCCLTKTKTSSHKPTETTILKEEDGDGDRDKIVETSSSKPMVKLHLKHRLMTHGDEAGKKESNTVSRLIEKKLVGPKPVVALAAAPESDTSGSTGRLVATLESGVSLGSGDYLMDVFVEWSFWNVTCRDPRCQLVSSPDPLQPCKADNQSCPYFYWYGDLSNLTSPTGDFALMTFTVNLTSPTGKSEFRKIENVMFGCKHWNRGLFHGVVGLLGLGRGPLCRFSNLSSLRRPLCRFSILIVLV